VCSFEYEYGYDCGRRDEGDFPRPFEEEVEVIETLHYFVMFGVFLFCNRAHFFGGREGGFHQVGVAADWVIVFA
jgi:hypothetical protein